MLKHTCNFPKEKVELGRHLSHFSGTWKQAKVLEHFSPGSQVQCFVWGISSVTFCGACCFSEPLTVQLGSVRDEAVTPSCTRLLIEARGFQTFLPTGFLNTATTMKPLFFLVLIINRPSELSHNYHKATFIWRQM